MATENENSGSAETPIHENTEQIGQRRRKRSGFASDPLSPGDRPAEKASARVSLPVSPDGTVDWEKATPDTREKLKRMLRDDRVSQELGLNSHNSSAAAAAAATFDATLVGPIYDGLSALFVAAAKRAGYTEESAGVMAFSPEEKASLTPGTVAVLNKYSGHMGEYAEEIMLATSVLMIVTVKWSTLKKTGHVLPFPQAVPVPPGVAPATVPTPQVP